MHYTHTPATWTQGNHGTFLSLIDALFQLSPLSPQEWCHSPGIKTQLSTLKPRTARIRLPFTGNYDLRHDKLQGVKKPPELWSTWPGMDTQHSREPTLGCPTASETVPTSCTAAVYKPCWKPHSAWPHPGATGIEYNRLIEGHRWSQIHLDTWTWSSIQFLHPALS